MYRSLLTLTLLSMSAPAFAFAAASEQKPLSSQHSIEQAQSDKTATDQTVAFCSTIYGCGDNHNETMLSV